MRHSYRITFAPYTPSVDRAARKLVEQYPALSYDPRGMAVASSREDECRSLFHTAQREGIRWALSVITWYDRDDVLSAPFGIFRGGGVQPDQFRAVLPKDSFDFSGACSTCGLGARQVEPHLLSQQSLRCKPRPYGTENSRSVMLPTPVSREIIEATGQPGCMRHPRTREGGDVENYMEPVPMATMPPLSRELSQGISFGSTDSFGGIGDPPKVVPPCPECGREIWDFDRSQHSRLVYSQKEAEGLRSLAVVVMDEPWSGWPEFDPKQQCIQEDCSSSLASLQQ